MTRLTLKKTIILKAPPDHVWKFLTEKNRLATWFHEGETDFEANGIYALVTNTLGKEGTRLVWGKVLTFDTPRKLVHTFTHQGLMDVETTCTWTLKAVDQGTILSLEHTGFEKASDGFSQVADHDIGWDDHFARLRRVVS